MGWLTLLKFFLQLALSVSGIVRERQLMDAGEAQATARNLVEIGNRLGIGKQIVMEVEALSDSDLDAALRGDK